MYTPVFSLLGTLQYNQYKTGGVSIFFSTWIKEERVGHRCPYATQSVWNPHKDITGVLTFCVTSKKSSRYFTIIWINKVACGRLLSNGKHWL